MIVGFLWSWLANAIGLFAAAFILSSIDYGDKLIVLVVASLIFGLVNSLIRPFIIILSLPAIVVTLGVFTLFINALMLWITSVIYPSFQVKSLRAAFGAVIVVWLVNYVFDLLITKEKKS
ncbi:MAG: phage holin family protein [Candidatus Saccharibacteria bacterium]